MLTTAHALLRASQEGAQNKAELKPPRQQQESALLLGSAATASEQCIRGRIVTCWGRYNDFHDPVAL
jgi:hypothetical protein